MNQAVIAASDTRAPGDRMFELSSALTTRVLEAECARLQPLATVTTADGAWTHSQLTHCAERGLHMRATHARGPCRLELALHGVMFVIEARVEAGKLADPRWFTYERRAARRLPVAPASATLAWYAHDVSGECITSEVLDLTPGGVLIRLAPGSALPSGDEPFPAELAFGGKRVSCFAELRRLREHHGARVAGLRLTTDPQDRALEDYYLAQRLPRLRRRGEAPAGELKQMLERSGYLALRDANQVSSAWCGLLLPNESSCDMVYFARDGSLLGHISTTRVYSDTWLFHQLATLPDHDETVACRKDLYTLVCAVPSLYSGARAHGLAYFDLSKRWHRLFFEDFTRWVGDAREACISRLDRFERSDATLPSTPDVEGHEARLAARSELVSATAMVRAQLSGVLADALDITPWRLRQRALCGAERAERYTRAREVFVLHGPDGIAGVALCELGSRELSLFDILHMAFVFVCPRRRPSSAAQRMLLARVRAYYADHGVHNPLVVAPHGTLDAESEPGTKLVETMGAIGITALALRQYQNFVHLHFQHQLSRNQPTTRRPEDPHRDRHSLERSL